MFVIFPHLNVFVASSLYALEAFGRGGSGVLRSGGAWISNVGKCISSCTRDNYLRQYKCSTIAYSVSTWGKWVLVLRACGVAFVQGSL